MAGRGEAVSGATPLFDDSRYAVENPCASRHRGAPTSEAAHESIRESKAETRARVLRYITWQGRYGATWDEISGALDIAYANSGRITELLTSGEIVDAGTERPTRSGRAARVVVAKAFA